MLKARHLQATNARTIRQVPLTRSTEDVDCFLSSEIITDPSQTEAIRNALDQLGYAVITEHFQFERSVDYEGHKLKTRFDFLAAPLDDERVKTKGYRTRARAFPRLHAHVTPEAFPIESSPIAIGLDGSETINVYIPHPFAYLILKLFALRDGLADDRANDAKYHALDMFTIWTMITEDELEQIPELRSRYGDHPIMQEASIIVRELFADPLAPGTLAMRTQARDQNIVVSDTDLISFLFDLNDFLIVNKENPNEKAKNQRS